MEQQDALTPGAGGIWATCGAAACTTTVGVRLYPAGRRCPAHTPAALAGRAEPPELTGRPWWIRADGTVVPLLPVPTVRRWAVDNARNGGG
nr:hypothetical protein [Micromonospora sp. DSM 115978]